MAKRTMQWAQIDGKQRLLVGGKVNRFIPNPTWDPISKPGALDEYFRGPQPQGRGRARALRRPRPVERAPEYLDRDARLRAHGRAGHGWRHLPPHPRRRHGAGAARRPARAARGVPRFQPLDRRRLGLRLPGAHLRRARTHDGRPRRSGATVEWALERDARFFVHRARSRDHPLGSGVARPTRCSIRFWRLLNEAGVTVAHRARRQRLLLALPRRLGRGRPTWRRSARTRSGRSCRGTRCRTRFANLLAHGLFQRFPNLRMASIETGSDWVFHLFDKLKKSYSQTPYAYPEDPRETFKRHVWVSPYYEDELAGLRDLLGADRMLMGSDYPHAEGLAEPDLLHQGPRELRLLRPTSPTRDARQRAGALATPSRVTTLVWPPEAVPESVLDRAHRSGRAVRAPRGRRARRVDARVRGPAEHRSSSCCTVRSSAWATART